MVYQGTVRKKLAVSLVGETRKEGAIYIADGLVEGLSVLHEVEPLSSDSRQETDTVFFRANKKHSCGVHIGHVRNLSIIDAVFSADLSHVSTAVHD